MNTRRVPSLLASTLVLAYIPVWAQSSASISVPEFVKAGEAVQVSGTLDRAPNFTGGSVQWSISGPDGFTVQSSVELAANQSSFSFSYTIPAAAKQGMWSVSSLVFYDGVNGRIPLNFEHPSFSVIANKGLVYPGSAQIRLRPSEVQLLRGEALRIQAQIQDLKGRIKETPTSSDLLKVLRSSMDDALAALAKTQNAYRELDAGRSRGGDIDVFFSDIRTSYTEALSSVNRRTPARFTPAAFLGDASDSRAPIDIYPALAQGPLRALEHNELAYETVANADALTFNLEVTSTPAGARISYRRRGDQFTPAPDPTNATIKSLIYAIWIIRVEAPGMVAQEKEHNALNEEYHVLHFDLERARQSP